VPACLINIKYITIRAEKVASPVTALQGALPVIANFVALEQQIILVKTRSVSVWKWRRYKR